MFWFFGIIGFLVKVELSCGEVICEIIFIDEVFEGGDCYF